MVRSPAVMGDAIGSPTACSEMNCADPEDADAIGARVLQRTCTG